MHIEPINPFFLFLLSFGFRWEILTNRLCRTNFCCKLFERLHIPTNWLYFFVICQSQGAEPALPRGPGLLVFIRRTGGAAKIAFGRPSLVFRSEVAPAPSRWLFSTNLADYQITKFFVIFVIWQIGDNWFHFLFPFSWVSFQ